MKDPYEVLVGLALGRADMVRLKKEPPFIVHLTPKRALKLIAELRALDVPFGPPLGGEVPEPRDGEEWIYMGIVLDGIHVYRRAN